MSHENLSEPAYILLPDRHNVPYLLEQIGAEGLKSVRIVGAPTTYLKDEFTKHGVLVEVLPADAPFPENAHVLKQPDSHPLTGVSHWAINF